VTVDRRLLRWYPPRWRERYGDELLAMIEDDLAGRSPSLGMRLGLVGSGLCEQLREAGLTGSGRPAADRARGGAVAVLVGWTVLIVAGGAFAKVTERWQEAVPGPAPRWAAVGYTGVEVLAVAGAALSVVWAVSVVPALLRAVRAGAWTGLRRPVTRAIVVLVLAGAATAAMALWARHLNTGQRNGGLVGYDVGFVAWGLSVAAGVVALGVVAVKVERRLDLSAVTLRLEVGCAALLGVSGVGVGGGMATWWVSLAVRAPWAITGATRGVTSAAWAWPLGSALLLGLGGAAVAGAGATRVLSAAREGL
jgi:hypothetical protein